MIPSKKFIVSGSGFLFIAAMLFCCQPNPPKDSLFQQAKLGKDHFLTHCARCHGNDAKGMKMGDTDETSADLTVIQRRRGLVEFPIQEIAQLIDGRRAVAAHGPRTMPVWGERFTEQEDLSPAELRGKLAEIIAYLKSIQQPLK